LWGKTACHFVFPECLALKSTVIAPGSATRVLGFAALTPGDNVMRQKEIDSALEP
jgi:hypothetical protein